MHTDHMVFIEFEWNVIAPLTPKIPCKNTTFTYPQLQI